MEKYIRTASKVILARVETFAGRTFAFYQDFSVPGGIEILEKRGEEFGYLGEDRPKEVEILRSEMQKSADA
jgi:hypothetical protein